MLNTIARITRVLALGALLTPPLYTPPAQSATLLPNGEQTFVDENGRPIASGCVFFYYPATSTPKDTYTGPDGATPNTNPVNLDAAGRAIIYGIGTYRQVVQKPPCPVGGVQVWDQLTADTSGTATIYAGASSGTPNVITLTAANFSGTDGQVINFIASTTNTGPTTINAGGFGAIQVYRDSASGSGALVGGEIVATNAVSVIYDAIAGIFHILSPITWPNTSTVPVGAVIDFPGFTAPTNYAFAYGQAVNRLTYAQLLSAYTVTLTGTISSGTATITGLSTTEQLGPGQAIEGLGIPPSTTITRVVSASSVEMSSNATQTGARSLTFFAHGNGNGSTTFNIPNRAGRYAQGRDTMSGSAANVGQIAGTITTTGSSTAATLTGGTGVTRGMYVNSANIPAGTTISSITGTAVVLSNPASGSGTSTAARFSVVRDAGGLGSRGGQLSNNQVAAEIGSHTHANTLNDPGHVHGGSVSPGFTGTGATGTQGGGTFSGVSGASPAAVTVNSNITGITVNNVAAGSGNYMQFVPPTDVTNFIVRLVP